MTGIKRRLGSLLGPQGPKGPQGNRGLPGQDSLPADEAVSTYIREPLTASRAAVESVVEEYAATEALRSTDFNQLVLGSDRNEHLPPGTIAFYYTPTPMIFTDFSDGTVGETPEGWTSRWSDHGWALEQYGGSNVLSVDVPSGDIRSGLAWDAIQEVPGFDHNGEIVFKWRSTAGFSVPARAVICGSGDTGAESAYYGNVRNTAFAQFGKLDNGSNEFIGNQEGITDQRDREWVITRVRKQGNLLQGKSWYASDPEPGEWENELEDSDFTAGWWGLIARGYAGSPTTTLRIDWVGFAAGDYTAPIGAMS